MDMDIDAVTYIVVMDIDAVTYTMDMDIDAVLRKLRSTSQAT